MWDAGAGYSLAEGGVRRPGPKPRPDSVMKAGEVTSPEEDPGRGQETESPNSVWFYFPNRTVAPQERLRGGTPDPGPTL